LTDGDVDVNVGGTSLTGSDHLRPNRDDPLEVLDTSSVALRRNPFVQLEDIERGSTFHRFTPSDLVLRRRWKLGMHRYRLGVAEVASTTSDHVQFRSTSPSTTRSKSRSKSKSKTTFVAVAL
jgi:hypothetical protein